MNAIPEARPWPRTWPELCLLAHVAAAVFALRLLLPWIKLKTLVQWLERRRPTGGADPRVVRKAARYADALLGRLPRPRSGPCLPRSLILFYFARQQGLPVQLHCGVRRLGGQLQGHAWLSLHGEPFLEKQDPRQTYAITFSSSEDEHEPA